MRKKEVSECTITRTRTRKVLIVLKSLCVMEKLSAEIVRKASVSFYVLSTFTKKNNNKKKIS